MVVIQSIYHSSPSLTIRQIVSPSMWPAGRGVMTRPCPFPFNWDWLVYFNWAIFSKLRPPHPRWKCGRVKLLDVAFYIIFHNSSALINIPQHLIIQTWEAGLTSSEIIAPVWYIYILVIAFQKMFQRWDFEEHLFWHPVWNAILGPGISFENGQLGGQERRPGVHSESVMEGNHLIQLEECLPWAPLVPSELELENLKV